MLRIKIVFLFIVSLSGSVYLSGQEILFRFNFDDCSFEESNFIFPGLTPGGNPQCDCGMGKNSFRLDGINDFLSLSPQANMYFSNNFMLDFYFKLDNAAGETDIMSHRSSCNSLDSLMALRYFSSTNELLFEIGSNVGNYHSVRSVMDRSKCWHRFTLVKFGLEYQVYIDNVAVKKIIARENIQLTRNGSLSFGNSPCNSVNQASRFRGNIDEIVLYDRAFSEREVKQLFRFPDRIITENTTIFKGESILLTTGPTCASTINWSPSNTLDNPQILSPNATPEVNTTYKITLNYGNCISEDTVRIFVAEKEKLDCEKLLLPKAFTPNNDGLNDRFGISNTFLIESLDYFEVYDRWGAKVWEATDIRDQWDGTFKNQPLNGGMYIYKIRYTCDGNEKVNINNFTLIR